MNPLATSHKKLTKFAFLDICITNNNGCATETYLIALALEYLINVMYVSSNSIILLCGIITLSYIAPYPTFAFVYLINHKIYTQKNEGFLWYIYYNLYVVHLLKCKLSLNKCHPSNYWKVSRLLPDRSTSSVEVLDLALSYCIYYPR